MDTFEYKLSLEDITMKAAIILGKGCWLTNSKVPANLRLPKGVYRYYLMKSPIPNSPCIRITRFVPAVDDSNYIGVIYSRHSLFQRRFATFFRACKPDQIRFIGEEVQLNNLLTVI